MAIARAIGFAGVWNQLADLATLVCGWIASAHVALRSRCVAVGAPVEETHGVRGTRVA